jgi:hypothetical protein
MFFASVLAACTGDVESTRVGKDAAVAGDATASTGGVGGAGTGGRPSAGAAGSSESGTGGARTGGTGGLSASSAGGTSGGGAGGSRPPSMGGAATGTGGLKAGTGGTATGTGGTATGTGGSMTSTGGTISYSTNFDLTESPLSEGGAWKHLGLDWTLVNTSNGLAWGTQTGSGAYDDSYAYLSGFPPDQMASGVVHLASPSGAATHEVEILLHWSDDAHDARGYECNLAWNGGYAEIVRWNGPINDFTYLDRSSAPMGVHEGDTLSAKIVGNTITSYLNGVQIATATDSMFRTGNPGIGLWRGGGAPVTLRDYAFTSFTAMSLP